MNNPDTYVSWYRTDKPGDYPTWESQCGIIKQLSFGSDPLYRGFVGTEKEPLPMVATLSAAKKAVQEQYVKDNELVWEYTD